VAHEAEVDDVPDVEQAEDAGVELGRQGHEEVQVEPRLHHFFCSLKIIIIIKRKTDM
jgi:hypothetical protein